MLYVVLRDVILNRFNFDEYASYIVLFGVHHFSSDQCLVFESFLCVATAGMNMTLLGMSFGEFREFSGRFLESFWYFWH